MKLSKSIRREQKRRRQQHGERRDRFHSVMVQAQIERDRKKVQGGKDD